jgi:hypothetical protein
MGQAPPTGEPLAGFLDDGRRHLRAKNRSRGTIESYLTVGRAFCDYLTATDRKSDHAAINRQTVESYLADLNDRLSPATTAKHYRSPPRESVAERSGAREPDVSGSALVWRGRKVSRFE